MGNSAGSTLSEPVAEFDVEVLVMLVKHHAGDEPVLQVVCRSTQVPDRTWPGQHQANEPQPSVRETSNRLR